MPLTGEYAPSAFDMARNQVDLYERSGGTEGTAHPTGERVIVLTSVGAKTGKLRSTPDTAATARLVLETLTWFARLRHSDPYGAAIGARVAEETAVDALLHALVPVQYLEERP